MNILAARRYYSPRARPLTPDEAATRAIAYALKDPRRFPEAVEIAADEMALLLRDEPRAALVPVPTSAGDTGPNRLLAAAIAQRMHGRGRVTEALERVRPVESSCARRRRGLAGLAEADHDFRRRGPMLPADVPVYLVDNVTTTGATLRAARAALHFGDALVFADATPNRA